MAGISVQSKTSSSVTLYVSGLDTSWADGTRTVKWYLTKSGLIPTESAYDYTKSTTLADGVSSGGGVTFSGLEANHKYGILCTIYHGSTLLASLTGEVITDYSGSGGGGGGTSDIAYWTWTDSNGTAYAIETKQAYNAVVNKTATTNFSRYVWLDMIDKVKELTDKTIGYWDTDYASYDDTTSLNANLELEAVKFNSLRNNLELVGNYVNLGYRTDIGKVNPGDKVYGEYFLTLADYINACIDNL